MSLTSCSAFDVVDFVLRVDGQPLLLNSTVSDKHGIKIESETFREVLKAVDLLRGTAEIPFLWVLPEDGYGRKRAPGPLTPKTAATTKLAKRIAQYKVLVEIPSTALPPASAASAAGAGCSDSDDEGASGSDNEGAGGSDDEGAGDRDDE